MKKILFLSLILISSSLSYGMFTPIAKRIVRTPFRQNRHSSVKQWPPLPHMTSRITLDQSGNEVSYSAEDQIRDLYLINKSDQEAKERLDAVFALKRMQLFQKAEEDFQQFTQDVLQEQMNACKHLATWPEPCLDAFEKHLTQKSNE